MIKIIARNIHITGLVQGVGFRPFIFRLAQQHGITGWVINGNDGVRIFAEGDGLRLSNFTARLQDQAPAAAQIFNIAIHESAPEGHASFQIRKSSDDSERVTEISPDIAVCGDCLQDLRTQPHRIGYPFINCTNCGPRFTIIKDLPYDRHNTTMEPFPMCEVCRAEYSDVHDRRFHAQPVACIHCGPQYKYITGNEHIRHFDEILARLSIMIEKGRIIVMKGMGGYHLACDAFNEEAASTLRLRKNREGKPFAVMFRSVEDAMKYLFISDTEKNALETWRRPIVIVQNRPGESQLAKSISNGFGTTGIMLPYLPLHYLLFEHLHTPAIVLTSGNISDEPVIIDDREALEKLAPLADAWLINNRDIHNRADDSVIMVSGNAPRLIRRSRGFAPSPVNLSFDTEGIFAAGAELVNCFCIGKGQQAIMSQHIGDLKNLETLEFYTESVSRFRRLFRLNPSLVACDLHPDYLSTRFAEHLASDEDQILLVRVQHHYAHIAACMAEYGIDEKVIGVSMDGVGFGDDGHSWGFEFFTCDLLDYERVLHLAYTPQPGGDLATHEPWRMALAYLYRYVDKDFEKIGLPFMNEIGPDKMNFVRMALENNINTPLSSSAGRLFDAVAAMTGICTHASFHAEAPMRLEQAADWNDQGKYLFSVTDEIHPGLVIESIVNDLQSGTPSSIISARFHRAVTEVIVQSALLVRQRTGLTKIVLSGGTFQNRFILAETETMLMKEKFEVFIPALFPVNDGGIALGQLAVAAKRRISGNINL